MGIEITKITPEGVIEVRETTVNGDGTVSNHRHVVEPTDSTENEDDIVKAVAAEVHTQAVVDAYVAMKAGSA